jgi:hypothetical protein
MSLPGLVPPTHEWSQLAAGGVAAEVASESDDISSNASRQLQLRPPPPPVPLRPGPRLTPSAVTAAVVAQPSLTASLPSHSLVFMPSSSIITWSAQVIE